MAGEPKAMDAPLLRWLTGKEGLSWQWMLSWATSSSLVSSLISVTEADILVLNRGCGGIVS